MFEVSFIIRQKPKTILLIEAAMEVERQTAGGCQRQYSRAELEAAVEVEKQTKGGGAEVEAAMKK